MSVLLIAGSPSERSRTAALLEAAGNRLEARGVLVERLRVRDLSPQALLLADFGHPSISQATGQVAGADVVIVATPVYKAAYSGVLKVFLDLLPQNGFKDKVVLPLATGGSGDVLAGWLGGLWALWAGVSAGVSVGVEASMHAHTSAVAAARRCFCPPESLAPRAKSIIPRDSPSS